MANIQTSKTREVARRGMDFFRDHDKGSARPAFCYPSAIQSLREEYDKIDRLLKDPHGVEASHRPVLEEKREKMKQRLDSIDEQIQDVRKAVKADPDYWEKRHKELGEQIRDISPSKSQRKLKKVSAFRVNRMEKGEKSIKLSTGEKFNLSEAKKEYQIISRALDKESNVGMIEKD